MKSMKYAIPNLLTLCNLLVGATAIIIVFRGQNEYNAAWLIFVAALFDLLDGLAARLLKAGSEFGKQLDSLADMVSFGLAPSIILFHWLYIVLTKLSAQSTFQISTANLGQSIVLLGSLLFAVGAALRLARFNIKQTENTDFTGLPTPAAALIVASLWLIVGATESEGIRTVVLNVYFVIATILVLFILMISNVKMLSLKFKGLGFKKNLFRYIILITGLMLVLIFGIFGIFFSLMAYLIISLISNFVPAEN
jgi:CDP-diacylglycerol--serine O-phosphatidyltransferase